MSVEIPQYPMRVKSGIVSVKCCSTSVEMTYYVFVPLM
jgi:hypothetical protein